MTGVIRLVALNGVALLGFAVLVAMVAALAHRTVAAQTRALPPSLRARFLVAWATTPVAVATALVGLALWPSLGAALGLSVDHCPAHAGHIHLCLHHLPARGPGVIGALGLATLAVVAGSALVQGVRSTALAARLARARSFALAPGVGVGVGVVESSRPFALTVGWFRPSVLVSTTLLERLTPAQLQIVVAHERAHADRRDALAVTAARVLSLAHLPSVRRRILADLMLACEQACDEAAARECGDRVLVAETILAAERAAASDAPSLAAGLAFGGGEVANRVESLLAAPVEGATPRLLRWILLAAGTALAAAAPHVHHWTETFLDRLPR
jgi:Zn-dependent protease with chaperone function